MKRININNYNTNMGTLIDLSEPNVYIQNKIPGSINIPYDRLLLHYKEFLDKNKKYYFICSKGIHSRKAASILEFYGYDVTQVVRND